MALVCHSPCLSSLSRTTLPPDPVPHLETDVAEPAGVVAWEPTRATWAPRTVVPLVVRHQSGCGLKRPWAASSMLEPDLG